MPASFETTAVEHPRVVVALETPAIWCHWAVTFETTVLRYLLVL
jgi:hypothetical protein